jgi:hypothetical protein
MIKMTIKIDVIWGEISDRPTGEINWQLRDEIQYGFRNIS